MHLETDETFFVGLVDLLVGEVADRLTVDPCLDVIALCADAVVEPRLVTNEKSICS